MYTLEGRWQKGSLFIGVGGWGGGGRGRGRRRGWAGEREKEGETGRRGRGRFRGIEEERYEERMEMGDDKSRDSEEKEVGGGEEGDRVGVIQIIRGGIEMYTLEGRLRNRVSFYWGGGGGEGR